MAPRPLSQRWSSPSPPTIAHYNGRLQWQWHPAMAPRPQLPPRTIAHYNGTQQWHHVHSTERAPSNGTTSTPLLPPTIAHYNGNGTQQWHHVHPPKVGRRPPPQPYHTTMAPYDGTHGTQPLHPAMAGWVPRPIRQSGSSPSPPIGSKNPYSYRYLGKNSTSSLTWWNVCIPYPRSGLMMSIHSNAPGPKFPGGSVMQKPRHATKPGI